MSALFIRPDDAGRLAAAAHRMGVAARELVSFWTHEPALAGQASVEVLALEAKSILAGGAIERVVAAARSSRPSIRQADLSSIQRLEEIAALSESRLDGLQVSLEGDSTDVPLNRIGTVVSLAATALGLIKTVV